MIVKVEKCCQTCQHHSCGIGAVTANGTKWMWQDCAKGWGKPTPIGVLKNMCGLYILKKELNNEINAR